MAHRDKPRPIKILHLEDDLDDAELVDAQLSGAGLLFTTVLVDDEPSFQTAVSTDSFDLVISDNTLKNFDGISALGIARRVCPETPFIFVSGTIGEEKAIEAMRAGANDYVLKHRLEKLPLTVERVLRESGARSERKRIEEALFERERLFRQLAESIREVFWVATPDLNQVLYVSPAYEEIWGQSVESLYQSPRSKYDAVHPQDRDELLSTLLASSSAMPGGKSVKYRIARPGGATRWILERAYPSMDSKDRVIGLAGVARDITDQVQLEEQLMQSQKLEAVGRLAGGLAHDFNNVLSVILGYSDLVLDEIAPGDPKRELLEIIKRAGTRAAGLTRQLLAFSRRQVLQPRVLDLNAIVAEVSNMLHPVIGEDIALRIVLGPDLGRVKADPGQIEQVLMNLMVNARDAMPGGGEVVIETTNADVSADALRVRNGAAPGPHVVLSVADTGAGMSEDVLAQIFEPFFTTKGQDRGTGLGLATVLGIVEQSGGFVEVTSQPGMGSLFRVHLPRVDEPVEAPTAAAPRAGRQNRTATILLVEDQEDVRSFARTVLVRHGYAVVEAETAERALEIIEAELRPVDLLVCDVVLPGKSGPALAEVLLQHRPKLRLLFMSGYVPDAVRGHALRPGGAPILEKPFTGKDLLEHVADVLDRPI